MTKYLLFVVLVAFFAPTTRAIDRDCDYFQDAVPGTIYYVYNSEYPSPYRRARSCRWYARSTTRLRLSCQIFSLPASPNCIRDRLAVSPSGDLQLADARNYCGTGTFEIISTSNVMNIVFTAPNDTRGGRFSCSLQATAPTAPTTPSCNCGWKNRMRIVGGTAAGINEYPAMAALVDFQQQQVYCGGTIISTKHVMSAAHCRLPDVPISRIGVLVGDHDISTGAETNAARLHLVSSFVIHPAYNSDTQANDIAILTVVDNIIFSMEVGPACLPFRTASTSFEGLKMTALGWGTLEFAGATSDVLQKVQLDVRSTSSCQETFPGVTTNQMCTFTPGKDACQFDSGGPLFWENPSTMRIVSAGIISYGQVCADTTPAVNTRVGAYMNWILSVTPGADFCRLE